MSPARTFSTNPPPGDYILTTSGVTWNLDRRTAAGGVLRILAGEPNRQSVLARLLGLAEQDRSDAWETFGADTYRLIKRFR